MFSERLWQENKQKSLKLPESIANTNVLVKVIFISLLINNTLESVTRVMSWNVQYNVCRKQHYTRKKLNGTMYIQRVQNKKKRRPNSGNPHISLNVFPQRRTRQKLYIAWPVCTTKNTDKQNYTCDIYTFMKDNICHLGTVCRTVTGAVVSRLN